MKHARGQSQALPVLTAAPTIDGQGVALSIWDDKSLSPVMHPARFLVKLVVGGTGSASFTLYGNEGSAVWGIPCDPAGNQGSVCGGLVFGQGTFFFIVEDIGAFTEAVLLKNVVSGSPTATATITNLIEMGSL